MKNDKRTCFAMVAATIINKRRYNGVHDFSTGEFTSISSISTNDNYLSFFDYKRGGYVSGSKTSLYDYPTSSYVSLNINGVVVNCFDYETSSYVGFTVNNNSIVAFDYQTAKYYNYSVV
jgi:hypothetical protein